MNQVLTPCVGLCSTTYGDLVCRGCRRTSDEITQWHGLDEGAKRAIVNRLDQQIETVFKQLFVIEDSELLASRIKQLQLNHDLGRSPWAWLFVLLVKRADQIDQPEEFGFRALPTEFSLAKVTRLAMRDMYQLAEH